MNVATIIFGCTMYLLPSFVLLYTRGINDASYYQPIFSIIIVLAEYVYCIRDPYISVVYSAGKFKETARSAYLEAIINIVLSVVLVKKFELVGIAIGTLVGMTYRMLYQVVYISKNILYRPASIFFKRLLISISILIVSPSIIKVLDVTGSNTIVLWVKNGFLCLIVYSVIAGIMNLILDREVAKLILKRLLCLNRSNF